MLSENQNLLSKETLCRAMGALSDRFLPSTYAEIDSTNAEAKRLALDGVKFAVVAADFQTAGRGRMGRSFYSPNGRGAYFSILYTPTASLSDAVSVTSASAVAVMHAIRSLCDRQTEIKWVNDLYLDEKKVCGILAESVCRADGTYGIIIGIGINLHGRFEGELAEIASSIDANVTREELIAEVLRELLPYLDDPSDRSWLMDYRLHSCVLGREITWTRTGETWSGRAIDIDENGALLVQTASGEQMRLATGEISLRVNS